MAGKEKRAGLDRPLRMGMVGGGPGAFIGEVHRKAARLDGGVVLTAGAFDIDAAKSRQMGRELYLDSRRVYNNFEEMIAGELALGEEERIDFVSVCTPNNWHYPIAKAFLEAGIHVMCEKPMTLTLEEAKQLRQVVKRTGLVFGLMHNYTGYPMVKLARDMVRGGDLGEVLKVVVQYPQGWLIRPIERGDCMQAKWRTDPKQSGAAGSMGDIGTHAENLVEYVTGLKILEVCADLTTFVKGRRLDDDGNCLLHLEKGARGVLHASQVSVGQENNLAVWVHGRKGSVEWRQEAPNELVVTRLDEPVQVWRRGNAYVAARSESAARATRLPAGHPEAFIEAFANIYRNFTDTVRAAAAGVKPKAIELDFPGVEEGVRGMGFIASVVASQKSRQKWTKMKA